MVLVSDKTIHKAFRIDETRQTKPIRIFFFIFTIYQNYTLAKLTDHALYQGDIVSSSHQSLDVYFLAGNQRETLDTEHPASPYGTCTRFFSGTKDVFLVKCLFFMWLGSVCKKYQIEG